MRKSNQVLTFSFLILLVFNSSFTYGTEDEKAREQIIIKFKRQVDAAVTHFYRTQLKCEGLFTEINPIAKKIGACDKLVKGDVSKFETLEKYVLSQKNRFIKQCLPDYNLIAAIGSVGMDPKLLEKHCTEENFKVAVGEALPVITKNTKGVIDSNKKLFINNAKRMMSWYWSCPRDQPIYKCHHAIDNAITKYKTAPSGFTSSTYPAFDLSSKIRILNDSRNNNAENLQAASPHSACSESTNKMKKDYLKLYNSPEGSELHQAFRWLYGAFWHCVYHSSKIQSNEVDRIQKILMADSGMRYEIDNNVEYRDHLSRDFFSETFDKELLAIFINKYPRLEFSINPQYYRKEWRIPKLSTVINNYKSVFKSLDMAENSLLIDLENINSIQLYEAGKRLHYGSHAYGRWATNSAFKTERAPDFKVINKDITAGFRRPLEVFDIAQITDTDKKTIEKELLADKVGFELYHLMRSRMLEKNELITFDFILKSGERRLNMTSEFSKKSEELSHIKDMYSWEGKKEELKLFVTGNGNNNKAELIAEGFKVDNRSGLYTISRKIGPSYYFKMNTLRREQYVQHENSSTGIARADSSEEEEISSDPSLSTSTVFTDDSIVVNTETDEAVLVESKKKILNPVSRPRLSPRRVAKKIKKLVKKQFAAFSELCMEIVPVGLNSSFTQGNARALYSKCSSLIKAGNVNCKETSTKSSKCEKIRRIEKINRKISSLQNDLVTTAK